MSLSLSRSPARSLTLALARSLARSPARRRACSPGRSLALLSTCPLAVRPAPSPVRSRSPGRSAACCSAGPRLLFMSFLRPCAGRLSAAASFRKGKARQSVCARAAASVSACQWSDRVHFQGMILTGKCLALSVNCLSLAQLAGPAEVQLLSLCSRLSLYVFTELSGTSCP
jgi:hypothetical protein